MPRFISCSRDRSSSDELDKTGQIGACVRRLHLAKQIMVAAVTMQLGACSVINIPHVDRIKLVSVAVLDQSQIPDRDKYWRSGAITTPLVQVVLATRSDLDATAKEWGEFIGNVTSVCHNGSIDTKQLLRGYPMVYSKRGAVYRFPSSKVYRPTNSDDTKLYHSYFDPRQLPNRSGWRGYDLVRKPQDICVRIYGVNESLPLISEMIEIGFRSNVVIIPRQALQSAFANANLR